MLIFLIIFIIAIVLYAAIHFASLYFVNFSLNRRRIGRFDEKQMAKSDVPLSAWHDETSELKKYINECTKEADEWIKTVSVEKIHLVSADGLKLYALLITHTEKSENWLIGVHGYCEHKEEMFPLVKPFFEKGFNLLLPDLRAHGESEGEYIGMGWPDRADLLLWTNYIATKAPDAKIAFYGVSMGAATVMMTSGEALPPNVRVVIEDSGYTSVYDEFANQARELFKLPKDALKLISGTMKKKAGYTPQEASALKQVKLCALPMLFIHSTDDNFVPVEMAHKLYEAKNGVKKLHIVEQAGHVGARYKEKQAYYDLIFDFIEENTDIYIYHIQS